MFGGLSFGRWLKQRRKQLDLTQAMLAERVGCAAVTLRKIESGRLRPSRQLAERLADQLDVPVEERPAFIQAARHEHALLHTTPIVARPQFQLPSALTQLIGREAELAELAELLATPACRLVTILGPGGIGKTRLALAAAERATGYDDGAAFVALAEIGDPTFIAPAILSALGVPLHSEHDSQVQLLDVLRPRALLLVLDNLEQLLPNQPHGDALIALLSEILAHAPRVSLLATSRERLGAAGEWLYDLGGLCSPSEETAIAIEASSAGRLFVQRARQVRRQFTLTDGEASTVARLCRLVEGMPLAIELAAAALRSRSCTDITATIEHDLAALASGQRALPQRHRSLFVTFEHSWRLLNDLERRGFARLAVFRGGFDETAAVHVAQASAEMLAALVDKSLVRWDGVERYDLHELLRQFASQKLAQLGEADEVGDRHLAYYCRLAEQAGQKLYGPEQITWSERLDRELGNLRAALSWSVEHDTGAGLRMAGALDRYWSMYRPRQEGIGWLGQLLQHPDASTPSAVRARALLALGWLHNFGQPSIAQTLAEQGFTLYQVLEDEIGMARALLLLGAVTDYQQGQAAGVPIVSQSLALARAAGDSRSIAEALAWLAGVVYMHNHDYEQARASYEEALTLFRQLGDVADLLRLLTHMAEVAAWNGDVAQARQWLDEAQALSAELRVIGDAFDLYEIQGRLALYEGRYAQAQADFEARLALSQASGGEVDEWALASLGYAVLGQGNRSHARALFVESIGLFRQGPQTVGVVYALEGVARLALGEGQPDRAARLYAWADALREADHMLRPPIEQDAVERDLVSIRDLLDETSVAAAQAAGRAMTIEEAAAEALAIGGALEIEK